MGIKRGDFVRINYTGRLKETGEVFDTTFEGVAKKHGIFDQNRVFKPQPIVVGAGHVLQGIDNGLVGAEVGEKLKLEIPPEDAYGNRDPSKVTLIPLREFKKKKINPVPGMHVEIGEEVGRIQSVGGGRVRVDLNHGLAGKTLLYDVSVLERTNKKEEKVRQILELYFPYTDPHTHTIVSRDKSIVIVLPDAVKLNPSSGPGKYQASRDIFTFIDSVEEVVFKEVHTKLVSKKKKKEQKKKVRKKTAKSS